MDITEAAAITSTAICILQWWEVRKKAEPSTSIVINVSHLALHQSGIQGLKPQLRDPEPDIRERD